MPLMLPAPPLLRASRSIFLPPRRPDSCPTSIPSPRICWRALSCFSLRLPPTRRVPSPIAPISRALSRWPDGSGSWCLATNAIPKSIPIVRRRACSKRQGRISPTSSDLNRYPTAPICLGCGSALSPAIENSSRGFWNCAMSRHRRCRCRRSAWPLPRMAMRSTSPRIVGSMRKNSISPIRSSQTATDIAGQGAASFSGSMSRHTAGTRPSRCGYGRRRDCAWCRGAISRARRPTGLIRVVATSASPWWRIGTPRRKRSTAWSRCWAEDFKMPATGRGLQSLSFLPDALREVAGRRLRELAGTGLIIVSVLLALALATWSVHDPSLSHATNAPVRNVLGLGGAIVADLLTQLFGLAALSLVAPIAIWGWRLASHRRLSRERTRLAFWLLDVPLWAACAAVLPRAANWPLPAGLGGIIGDWVLVLPAWIVGASPSVTLRAVAAVALALAALACLAVVAGFGFHSRDADADRNEGGEERA